MAGVTKASVQTHHATCMVPSAQQAAQWPVYVVTLNASAPRAVRAKEQLQAENVSYEMVSGVDWRALHRKRIEDVFDRERNKSRYKYPLSAAEIGCYLSHLTLWNRIAHSEAEGAFIFEDDFEAARGFGHLIRSISQLTLGGDIVSFHQSRWRIHRKHVSLSVKHSVVEPLIAPPRTTGYAISKRAALLLYKNALPFSRPVDMDLKHWWESGVRYLTVYPSPLLETAANDSAIDPHRSEQKRRISGWTRFARNIRYQSRFHSGLVGGYLRRRAGRLRTQSAEIASVEEIKTFNGHSGCAVVLCRGASGYFIRKKSASLDYNERLKGQMRKQSSARQLVRTPRVLNHGYENGLLYFDMDYVSGSDFFTQLATTTIDGIGELVDRILDVLENFSEGTGECVAPEAFVQKIASVGQAIVRHQFYDGSKETIDDVMRSLERANWSRVPKTDCHGDLTLENMLFAPDGSITLIDFLDGDLASVWLDLAKLLYDFESGWSLRSTLSKDSLSAEDRLVTLLSRYLHEEIRLRVRSKFAGILEHLPQLQMMQAMRVLPYVHDARTFARVTSFLDGVRGYA